MNSKQSIQLVLLLGVIIFMSACKKEKQWQPNPPYPGLEVKITNYTINSSKDTILLFSNGTSISIPANAMVTSDGKTINGSYEFGYREFHDAIDIMLSGIPMEISSMGAKQTLQTAGMFEMKAEQNGARLKLADSKKIDIRFASRYPGTNYSFFYMNPERGEWEWADLPETEINQQKIDAMNALDAKAPKVMLGDKYFIINFDRFLDIYFNDDYDKIYKNRNSKLIRQKLEGYKFKIYNAMVEGEVRFLRSYYQPAEMLWKDIDGKNFPSWTKDFERDWKKDSKGQWYITNYSFTSLGNNIYQVNYSVGAKSFSKKMEAVIPLSSILKLSADQWQQQYDEAMQKLKDEQAKVDLMAETYRSFSVNRLGTYNFDCLLKGLDEWTKVNASFTQNNKPSKEGTVIIILGDNSGYITVKPNDYKSMRINPKTGHRILMLMANQQLGIFPANKLVSINIDSLKALSSPSYTFNFEVQKVADAVEFRKILGFK